MEILSISSLGRQVAKTEKVFCSSFTHLVTLIPFIYFRIFFFLFRESSISWIFFNSFRFSVSYVQVFGDLVSIIFLLFHLTEFSFGSRRDNKIKTNSRRDGGYAYQ